jgi:hypothetical protein
MDGTIGRSWDGRLDSQRKKAVAVLDSWLETQKKRCLTRHSEGGEAESHRAFLSLRHLESSPILVRGPVTGRQCGFSAAQPVQPVDPRDAEALLRTRFFRRNT